MCARFCASGALVVGLLLLLNDSMRCKTQSSICKSEFKRPNARFCSWLVGFIVLFISDMCLF